MMKYRYIKRDLGSICRACLNKKYGIRLKTKDCIYEDYPRVCHECGEVKNIVCGIKLPKRLFL